MAQLPPEKIIELARERLIQDQKNNVKSLDKQCESLRNAIANAFRATSRHEWASRLAMRMVKSDRPLHEISVVIICGLEGAIQDGLIAWIIADDDKANRVIEDIEGYEKLLPY